MLESVLSLFLLLPWVVEGCLMERCCELTNVVQRHTHLFAKRRRGSSCVGSSKIKCCVGRNLFVMGRESGCGERVLGGLMR